MAPRKRWGDELAQQNKLGRHSHSLLDSVDDGGDADSYTSRCDETCGADYMNQNLPRTEEIAEKCLLMVTDKIDPHYQGCLDSFKQALDAERTRAEEAEKMVALLRSGNKTGNETLTDATEKIGMLQAKLEEAEKEVIRLRHTLGIVNFTDYKGVHDGNEVIMIGPGTERVTMSQEVFAQLQARVEAYERALVKITEVSQFDRDGGAVVTSEHYEAAWLDCSEIAQEVLNRTHKGESR